MAIIDEILMPSIGASSVLKSSSSKPVVQYRDLISKYIYMHIYTINKRCLDAVQISLSGANWQLTCQSIQKMAHLAFGQ